ncbi:MAG: OmpH family outer membrane protein [Bacteroidetes bacterium]|nr:OmpH family outer membrane protein [Bacteroidota bacterium]MBU1580715.1 OmpH family outer membrane protein [Bacteroidota bacterium]MBU2465639.1 OmpH family outer membrane protein [Bacteroidota bacterium]MBU2559114.1 OmpH family outer membrane protein [Bacteroidota bacterium]
MMKTKLTIVAVLALLFMGMLSAQAQNQRFGYVDTEYILENIPEYKDAQDELNVLSTKWEKEIKARYEQVEKLYRDYQTESVLLPEDMKRKREDEIVKKEQEAKDLQMKYFGPEGDLFIKRSELVEPIQEKVFNAIQEIAETRNYAFIFDKASGATMLYASDKFDISDEVLDEIGNVMQTVRREDRR